MNNQKLSRLLSPNLQLYFICLVIFTLATIPVSPMLAAGSDLQDIVELPDKDPTMSYIKSGMSTA